MVMVVLLKWNSVLENPRLITGSSPSSVILFSVLRPRRIESLSSRPFNRLDSEMVRVHLPGFAVQAHEPQRLSDGSPASELARLAC